MPVNREEMYASIPQPALERLPLYLNYLKAQREKGREQTSSAIIASDLGMTGIQVRKDLAYVSSGKPRTGRNISALIECLEEALGCGEEKAAVLVGAGRLGQALMSYDGFAHYGFDIVAAFDINEHRIGTSIRGRMVYPADRIVELIGKLGVVYGIITVSLDQAQQVCDQLVAGGVRAILNFAPLNLYVPENVVVSNVDIAASMLLLSNTLAIHDLGARGKKDADERE